MQEIILESSGETFFINTKVIRINSRNLEKEISRARWIPGEILKSWREAMTPYLARLLGISLNNATIPCDWKNTTEFPITQRGGRSAVLNYRLISLTSVVCKQLKHVLAGYLRQLWDKNDWLYEGRHRFWPGCSYESPVFTVWQYIA